MSTVLLGIASVGGMLAALRHVQCSKKAVIVGLTSRPGFLLGLGFPAMQNCPYMAGTENVQKKSEKGVDSNGQF